MILEDAELLAALREIAHPMTEAAAARIETLIVERDGAFARGEKVLAVKNEWHRLAFERGTRIAWFEEKADALARYASAKPPKESAMLAVVTELLADADRRALAPAAQDKDANG